MLAARYYAPRDIRVEDIPRPVPEGNNVLVRVQAAGICGSDMHNYRMGMFMTYAPVTMGHEFCGVVCETGPLVTTLQTGDFVVADSRAYCGNCRHCKTGHENRCERLGFIGEVCDGGFAEYALLGEQQLFKLPTGISATQAALLEPLAVALHIWEKLELAGPQRVAIVGAGPIGQLTALVASALSDAEILVVEPSVARRSSAMAMGAREALAPHEAARYHGWADCVVEAVGRRAALQSAFGLASRGSALVLAGLFEDNFQGDINPITEKELQVFGINGFRTENMQKAITLSKNGFNCCPLVSDKLPLSEVNTAFRRMDDPEACSGKILLLP